MRSRLGAFVLLFALCTAPCFAALHVGDHVQVNVYNHPELSGELIVDSNGDVTVPLIGTVAAAGLEPPELGRRIQTALGKYVILPAVDVKLVSEATTIAVAGPGGTSITFQPGETLVAAVDEAKPAESADLKNVTLVRDGKVIGPFDIFKLRAARDSGPTLEPGDTLNIPSKPVAVTVEGAVKDPGVAYLDDNEPLADAIDQVGGATDDGNLQHISLERDGTTQNAGLGSPVLNGAAQSGDRLMVPESPKVQVIGQVDRPGLITLNDDTTLLSALYLASPRDTANMKRVTVLRNGQKTVYDLTSFVKGNIGQNPTMQDGDIVFVPYSHRLDVAVSTFFHDILFLR